MARPDPKLRSVRVFRKSLTAVTRSLRRIEKRVISKYDGSWPTRVMSVPCSVVTMGISRPSISRARNAQVACGMA